MKSKNRKEQIYQVATQMFREKGYSSSSMRELAERVGLEPSSLYSHIKSKEEILIQICDRCADLFNQGIDEIIENSESSVQKIEALIDLHINIARDYPSSVTVFSDEWRHLPEKEMKEFLVDRKAYETKFKSIIAEGIESGEFYPMSKTTAFYLMINSIRWLHYTSSKRLIEDIENKRTEIKEFIKRGLVKK